MVISGHARPGDSGGPVFNARGRLVGVLWGTDGEEVGVRPGRPVPPGPGGGRARSRLINSGPANATGGVRPRRCPNRKGTCRTLLTCRLLRRTCRPGSDCVPMASGGQKQPFLPGNLALVEEKRLEQEITVAAERNCRSGLAPASRCRPDFDRRRSAAAGAARPAGGHKGQGSSDTGGEAGRWRHRAEAGRLPPHAADPGPRHQVPWRTGSRTAMASWKVRLPSIWPPSWAWCL